MQSKTLLTSIFSSLMLLSMHSAASADFAAEACHIDGPAENLAKHGGCTGYKLGKTIVNFSSRVSGDLLSAKGTTTVAAVQSYFYGRLNEAGHVQAHDGATNPVAVYLYREGKLLAAHPFRDLIRRPHLVGESVSHVRWTRHVSMDPASGDLTISTTDYQILVFDGRSGALRSQENHPDWTECDMLVRGRVDRKKGELSRPLNLKTGKRASGTLKFRWGTHVVPMHLGGHVEACMVKRAGGFVLERVL